MKVPMTALVLFGLGLGSGLAATPFDGAWTVSQTCPPTAEDVRGYQWVYDASVRNGMFTGVHNPSSPRDGSLRLEGRIQPDGGAVLTASGKAGVPEYNVGHVPKGYPLHFSVTANFTASSGSGTRTQQRPCDFSFTKN